MSFDAIDRRYRPRLVLACANCFSTEDVAMEGSRTNYPFEGEIGSPEDPNRPVPLCRPCATDHHLHWDLTWAEYRASVL